MKPFLLMWPLGLIALLRPSAHTITVPSTHDTSLYSGSGTEKSNGGGISFMVGTNNAPETRRGLLWFDLSAIPTAARLQSVSLKLALAKAPPGDTDRWVSLHRALASWGENSASVALSGSGAPARVGDATWLTPYFDQGKAWANAGGDFAALPSAGSSVSTALTDFTWSGPGMLADAQAWVTSPASNFGWFILGDESASRTNRQFFTHESTTPGTPPLLTVTYSVRNPQNAGVILIGAGIFIGLLALLGRCRSQYLRWRGALTHCPVRTRACGLLEARGWRLSPVTRLLDRV